MRAACECFLLRPLRAIAAAGETSFAGEMEINFRIDDGAQPMAAIRERQATPLRAVAVCLPSARRERRGLCTRPVLVMCGGRDHAAAVPPLEKRDCRM
jgi:hypothetical protein